jgi:geranyl-CoA carboxylase alpha subunit
MDDARRLAGEHGLPQEFIGWHSSHECPANFKIKWRDQAYNLEVMVHAGHQFTTTVAGEKILIDVTHSAADEFHYIVGGIQAKARIAHHGDSVWLAAEGATHCYTDITLAPVQSAAAGSDGRLLANSDGKVVAVHVKPGDVVQKGQTLAVLEAMKMEFQLALPVGGTVEAVSVAAGQQVKNRTLLVQVKPAK